MAHLEIEGTQAPFSDPPSVFGLPSPYYKESHHHLRKVVREWVNEHLTPNTGDWDEEGETPQWAYRQAAKDGLLVPLACGAQLEKWMVDEKDGRGVIGGIKPEEWDGFHDIVMIEEVNRAGSCGPAAGLFSGLQIGFPMLKDWASPELQKRTIPEILRGEKRMCLAITEPEAGTENKNISTRAERSKCAKFYIINGVKKWITNGVHADYFATAVRTSGKPGDRKGISVILIPRIEGVTTRKMSMGGQRCAGTSIVTFDDVYVPVENLIGEEDEGLKIVFNNFNHERMMMAITASRLCRMLLEDAFLHVSSRIVDGEPLLKKGVVLNKLAKMGIAVEAQQAWIESVVYQMDNLSKADGNRLLGGTTALIKANCSLVLEPVASAAVTLLGGIGYTKGGKGERVERMYREIKAFTIPGGSEDVMLDLGIRQQIKEARARGSKM